MPTPIEVQVGKLVLQGELGDSPCARSIARKLPIRAAVNVWGDEFYFEIPVRAELDETATSLVDIGTIGYWPPGRALAIFFGPTPMSTSERPVPASDVNLVGSLRGAGALRAHKGERSLEIREAPAHE
jgi:hypothetical protein